MIDQEALKMQRMNEKDLAIQKRFEAWKPRKKTAQCIGCIYSSVHVVHKVKASRFRTYEYNELSIYCYRKSHMIQHPYELCKERKEKPKKPINQW